MFVDRNRALGSQNGSAVVRLYSIVTPHTHTGVAIKNSVTWALWGGQAQHPERRHSCGVKVSERCHAATELRALYIYLVHCYHPKGAKLTVKMSHPRALAQMKYWLSTDDPSQLSMPRKYNGRKLQRLARLTFDLRDRISVLPTDNTDQRHIKAGCDLLKVMQKAVVQDWRSYNDYLDMHARVQL